MAFTTTPQAPVTPTEQPSQSQQSARERAIAKLTGGTNTEHPVQNPNNISPEELSAVRQPSETPEQSQKAEGQNDTNEPPKEATKEDSKPALSSQYAQLARKEKAIRQQVQELKAREAALAAREEALKPAAAQPSFDPSKYISKDELLNNPWDVLSQNGLTYDQLTQQALNQPDPAQRALLEEIRALKAEINTVKEETQGTKKSYENQQAESYNQAVNQIRTETKRLVFTDPTFEAIKATNSVEDVVDLIRETFKEDGILLTVEEAAKEVEDYLIEEATKLAKLSKIQQRLKPAAPAVKQETGQKQQQTSHTAKTLTNGMTAAKPMSSRDRAIAAFNNARK